MSKTRITLSLSLLENHMMVFLLLKQEVLVAEKIYRIQWEAISPSSTLYLWGFVPMAFPL